MAFDGELPLLTDVVRELGITPISSELLEAHKADEIRKHPPHWLIRHGMNNMRTMGNIFSGGIWIFVMGMILGPIFSLVLESVAGTILCGVASLASLVIAVAARKVMFGKIMVNGEAIWIETDVSWHGMQRCHHVPEPIATVARKLIDMAPDSSVVIGTLWQDEVMLDPYLIVRQQRKTGTRRIIVGIWDDTRIIHIAETR
jgi:hypothetical protein